ncbi:MAG TPA: zinc ribbon domain-containing protein [Candidatus Angelobacter sp.]|nr:zinc ribbon domain-containing protein [Candidatus Angelobacter sp.]
MDFIRDIADWVATDTLSVLATLFPLLMLGLLGLYVLWLVIGYLRVSQVGLHDDERREAIALPRATEAPELTGGDVAPALETTAGMPYCPTDGLAFPAGARFCTQCERDLVLDCTSCGATLNAAVASCYRCGTSTGGEAARSH